jgi:glycine betaine catabolism B
MPKPASTFKQRLAGLKAGEDILAAQVSGEFMLPKSEKQKLAFIAGGIGVTPFRSMIKCLIDLKQNRPIKMLYSANTSKEFAFTDLFKQAEDNGLQTLYYPGRIDKNVIKKAFPDSSERTFYISGPYGFVRSVKDALLTMGVPSKKIVSDYFPGYG